MPIIECKNISKTYGSKKSAKKYVALKSINFQVREGDFIGVMGASGSGKTTLLNLIGSIDKPTSGNIIFNGRDVAALSKKELSEHRMNNIGFIFQDYNLLESMTLKENIILPLALKGHQSHEIDEEVEKLAKDLNIFNVLSKYPYEVSGGEQQRAAACRALITKPKIILADEPTGNLDSMSGKHLLEMLEGINKKYFITILMVTHDLVAASYCEKILFIKDGDIYNQLIRHDDRKTFYNSIIDVMTLLGGNDQ